MTKEFLANFPYIWLAITGQILFLTIFVAAIFWIFRPSSKGFYQKLSALPLEEDNGKR